MPSLQEKWCSLSGGLITLAADTCITYIDIVHYPANDDSIQVRQCHEGTLTDASFHPWLQKDFSILESSGQRIEPSSSLRLMITVLDHTIAKLPMLLMSESSFAVLQRYVPTPYEYLCKPRLGSEFRLFTFSSRFTDDIPFSGLGYTIPSCGREGESYSPFVLLLNHNRLTNITYGFLQVENSVQNITPILDVLRSNNNLHSEAALLPLLFLESRLAEHNMRILQPYIKFNALETQLGQNEDSSGSGTDLMALNLNLGEMMRSINDATKALSLDEAYPWIMLSVMDTIVAWKGECCVIQDTRQHIDLNNRIRFVQDICKVVLAKARREQKRGKILIQWVYQAAAQKNAQINIALLENSAMIATAGKDDSAVMRQIAIETKKDNASMKTIAVLGMVFLPGTFVATVLTLPVFETDLSIAAGRGVGFVCFWAVTISLTVVVFMIWAMATGRWRKFFSGRSHKSLLG